MPSIRSIRWMVSLLVAMLFATSAYAQPKNYTFTGRLTSNRGKFINIPVVGNVSCAGFIIQNGPGPTMTPPIPAYATPATRTPTGANPTVTMIAPNNGCVKVAGKVVTTGIGKGGKFTFPTMAFSKPLYGLIAVPVQATPQVIQLATDFQIGGPNVARSPYTAMQGPTMLTAGNMAPHRVFQMSAHLPANMQSGRQGAAFTWCPGGMFNCVGVSGAPAISKMVVKYINTGTTFGGTMGYVITAGAGSTASLAIRIPDALGMFDVFFLGLAGMGEQPSGNGYAIRLTDMLASGQMFTQYVLGMAMQPVIGTVSPLLVMVTGPGAGLPGAINANYGFPFTVNTVLARNTGAVLGNPMVTTISAKGADTTTAMGARNISLVAGGLAHVDLLGSNTPGIAQLSLPEPGSTLQLLAGVAVLFGAAYWRTRKARA